MTQTQFLLLILAILPLVNCLVIKLAAASPKLIESASKFLPVLFLMSLIGLYGNVKNDNSSLTLIEAAHGISLGFAVDQLSLGYLFLLNFFWLIFAFYSQRFLTILEANSDKLQIFFTLIIAFVNLIILSKNLLSILFFYNCLIFLCHFFAVKFLHKKESYFSHFFTFLLYFESIFFFLAIVATYKFTNQIEFSGSGLISEQLSSGKYILLLSLYLSGLFLSVLIPCYLLYRNINLEPITIYSLFFLGYALSSLYIFIKLLNFIFGSLLIYKNIFGFIEWIFLIDIIIASIFLLFSKGLKSSFFYLFFQQLIFALFAIFTFATFDSVKINLSSFSFLFSLTLVFLCISNFVLYLTKAESKQLSGIFYDFKITTILFIFAIANLIGIAPGIGAVEKFFLLKIIIQKRLLISGIIFLINFLSLLIFAWKIFYPLFKKIEQRRPQSDIDLIKVIDFDSSLILSALVVAVGIFLLLIFFPIVINFLA